MNMDVGILDREERSEGEEMGQRKVKKSHRPSFLYPYIFISFIDFYPPYTSK